MMKNIGKPCAGESHARFDEGGLRPIAVWYIAVVACDKPLYKDWLAGVSSLLYPDFPLNTITYELNASHMAKLKAWQHCTSSYYAEIKRGVQ